MKSKEIGFTIQYDKYLNLIIKGHNNVGVHNKILKVTHQDRWGFGGWVGQRTEY